MIKSSKETKDTFWIAYADLMAGLLLVFVMLIAAIMVKYVLNQNKLESKERDILSFEEKIQELNQALSNMQSDSSKINEINIFFKKEIADLNLQAQKLQNEKENLNKNLQDKQNENFSFQNQNQKLLDENKNLKNSLLTLLTLNEDLNTTLLKKESELALMVEDLNQTKQRIEHLSSSKDKIISQMKSSLGKEANIDALGTLNLSSSVLFDKASSVLKESSKAQLKEVLTKYFDILLNNEDIKNNLDYIIIEGHTDSDGNYLSNLQLSQQRAYNVMEFINTFIKDDELRKYLMASGRSYMDIVKDKNGKEDKDASRRIEIKFVISNKEVMKEIENFLNYESN